MDIPLPPNPLGSLPDTIIEEIGCRKCGYNLRGLSSQGHCPECGTPTSLTVAGDRLRFSDPEWLEKLARGCRFIVWGIVITFALGCVAAAGVIFGLRVLAAASGTGLPGIVGVVVGLISVYGAWLLTTPEPARVGADNTITARKLVRVGILLGLFQSLLRLAVDPTHASRGLVQIGLTVLGLAVGLFWVVGEFAKFLYMQRLAERIPDLKMAGRANCSLGLFDISRAVDRAGRGGDDRGAVGWGVSGNDDDDDAGRRIQHAGCDDADGGSEHAGNQHSQHIVSRGRSHNDNADEHASDNFVRIRGRVYRFRMCFGDRGSGDADRLGAGVLTDLPTGQAATGRGAGIALALASRGNACTCVKRT